MEKSESESEYAEYHNQDFKEFIQQQDFIYLRCLKGEEKITEIQDKNSFKIYDQIEIIARGGDIDPTKQRCEWLMRLEHPNILKLSTQTQVYLQENLGDPYCKYILVFDQTENTLDKELQALKKKGKFFEKEHIEKLLRNTISGLKQLHDLGKPHGKLTPRNIAYKEKPEFKIIPNIVGTKPKMQLKPPGPKPQKREKKKGLFIAPENQLKLVFRNGQERQFLNDYKSEIFSLGMISLNAALLEDLDDCYEPFVFNQKNIEIKLDKFKARQGESLYNFLRQMLDINPENRPSCKDLLEKLNETATQPSKHPSLILKASNTVTFPMLNITGTQVKELTKEEAINNNAKKSFTIPQEQQDIIDKKVTEEIKSIESMQQPQVQLPNKKCHQQGERVHGSPNGWGILVWNNGERQEGHFSNGKQEGHGIQYWPNGVKHYGEFKNGEITGMGIRYQADGGLYQGEWLKGKNHGEGQYYWKNGASYVGGFLNDVVQGNGIVVWPDINPEDGKTVSIRRYEGSWKDIERKGIKIQKFKKNT